MATRGAKLVEHTRNDSYWGDGGDGTGKNMLGQVLMSLRDACAQMSNAERVEVSTALAKRGVNMLSASVASAATPAFGTTANAAASDSA